MRFQREFCHIAVIKVVVDALMLEEEGLVTPEGESDGARDDDTADKVTTGPRELMDGAGVGEYFEKNGTWADGAQLVGEIRLPGVGPTVDVVGFELEDEGPAGLRLSGAVFFV